ncbi:MAG: hypothetical protein NXI22_16160 [bacterium]|nr:hypothetical protein [bacterium]
MTLHWTYLNVDSDRIARLETHTEFSEILDAIRLNADLGSLEKCVESNRDELTEFETGNILQPHECQRIVFKVKVEADLFDIIVNSPFGLFGQYHASKEAGREAMTELASAILDNDVIRKGIYDRLLQEFGETKAKQFFERSLAVGKSVVWFDEHEFRKQQFPRQSKDSSKKFSINFMLPRRPQITTTRWKNGRPVFERGTHLLLKGCWITEDGRQATAKTDLDEQIYLKGFS